MDPDRWGRIWQVFEAALARPAAERALFLEGACAGDPEMRQEIESLLAADTGTGGPVDRAVEEAMDAAAAAPPFPETAPPAVAGQRLGPYEIVRELGRGGMGVVYLAVRADDQYRQKVAIKIVRGGLHSPDLLNRFLRERQILADLDHPNVARLLDGGTTSDGSPYVVMEYVEGERIDLYCDRLRLPIRERLRLFRQVCAAIQYAHRHLVVHRDIKPANILVNADGTPKLLDFGIAKLLDPGAGADAETGAAMRLLTPEYASPEQIRGGPITTAADVYSLGVLLYELLTGRLPFCLKASRQADLARAICETGPERPSAAVRHEPAAGVTGMALSSAAAPGASSARVSAARGTTPARLRRLLAGDLDTIVLMALRKEPERRYASAEQLSEDLRRHVEGLPVIALHDTWAYIWSKFIRRHPFGVTAAAAFAVLLTGSVVSTSLQSARIARERDRAQQLAAMVADLFKRADPGEARGETLTARELLDRGAARISGELAGQPETRSDLQDLIADIYQSLGLHDQAEPLLAQALATRIELYGNRDPRIADTLRKLGWMHMARREWDEADGRFREALAIRRARSGRDSLELAEAINNLAMVRVEQKNMDEALALFEESLAMRRRLFKPGDFEIAAPIHNMAELYRRQGNLDAAETLYREALEINRAARGEIHPSVARGLSALGLTLRDAGRLDEAEPLLRQAVAVGRSVWGDGSSNLAPPLANLAGTLQRRGDLAAAEPIYRELLENDRLHLGATNPYVAEDMRALARVLEGLGRLDESETLYRDALEKQQRAPGVDALETSRTQFGLALLLEKQGRRRDALALHREVLATRRSRLEPAHEDVVASETAMKRVEAAGR